MTTKSDLRRLVEAARPLIEQWLDVSEQIAALRDVATEKGIEWQPLKSLIKARVKDEQDDQGGDKNVRKILVNADNATAYADMLGWGAEAKKLFSSGEHAVVLTGVDEKRPRA